MCEREQRGILIAATSRITKKGGVWLVPSQSKAGDRYTVCPDADAPHCSCPDHETRGVKCKHIFAVEFVIKRESSPDGTETIVRQATVTETVRKTYPQKWSAYNAAQTNEKDKFLQMLHDLCRGIEEPAHPGRGRKPLPLASQIFAACYKVYSTVSGRRFMSDMRDAKARGYVENAPCYNSVFNVLGDEQVTPLLKSLIVESSLALKTIETDFAVDSSSFSSSRFDRWYDEKWGKPRSQHAWVKVQVMCGVKTNVITAVELPDHDGADTQFLPPLVRVTERNFHLRTVCADKGYSSVENHEVIDAAGAVPFIPFKKGTTGAAGGLWQKCFHYFAFRRDDFLKFYHKRSNIESTFSMVKAKFGDSLRSKTDVAMRNELLCKLLCHNIVCLIHAMYELGIEPNFWAESAPAHEITA